MFPQFAEKKLVCLRLVAGWAFFQRGERAKTIGFTPRSHLLEFIVPLEPADPPEVVPATVAPNALSRAPEVWMTVVKQTLGNQISTAKEN